MCFTRGKVCLLAGATAMTTDAHSNTPDRILAAAEALLVSSDDLDQISVRRIAQLAGVPPSAISYHFGHREELLTAAVRVIYRRFNAERLQLLQEAMDARAPAPPEIGQTIAALVGPSVRWSLDPRSSYQAFINLSALSRRPTQGSAEGKLRARDQHLKPFIHAFGLIAPHYSKPEIGFRVHCALGVRSNVVRERARLQALTGRAFNLDDAETVIRMMIDVIAPMFASTDQARQSPQPTAACPSE